MYKTIAAIETEDEAMDVYDELIDRYGDVPDAASNLIKTVLVRKLAARCGFSIIKKKGNMVLLYFKDQTTLPYHSYQNLYRSKGKDHVFSRQNTLPVI